MPTFDGGHCFLTALLPISNTHVVDAGGMRSSPVHMVREALSILPTAHQSPFTLGGPGSPFARDGRTHFARFAVIDDTTFNGRVPGDAILGKSDPAIPQAVDHLNCPYLMFAADFDAPKGDQSELVAYLQGLWAKAGNDLNPIFSSCHGFPNNPTPASFAAYVIGCQIETTMPFNDYWSDNPPLKTPAIAKFPLVIGSFAVFAAVAAVLFWIFARLGLFVDDKTFVGDIWPWIWPWIRCIEVLAIVALALAGGAYFAYRQIMWLGARPFPPAPNSDLPSVLKSLYLQRAFTDFAIRAQGMDDGELHGAFGKFIQATLLNEKSTDPAGAIPQREGLR
jgi:hypothetical protein